jgi:probable HAF family extracellular repeat protein
MTRYRLIVTLACAILALGHANAQGQCALAFQGVGRLPGGVRSWAMGLSGDGRVVAGVSLDPGGSHSAFRWTPESGPVALRNLPDTTGSLAFAANRDGSVIVGISVFGGVRYAVLWTPRAGVEALTDDNATPLAQTSTAVSADGTVIVGLASSDTDFRVFRWTKTAGVVLLPVLSGSNDERWGVSADGKVIAATASDNHGFDFAFRWTADSGVVALPSLPNASETMAFGISAGGQVIVGSNHFADNSRRATLWRGGTVVSLGILPGHFTSVALKTSRVGSVVVGSSSPSCLACAEASAFIWYEGRGIFDLRDVLVKGGLSKRLEGWTLVEANAVSDDGHVISGIGINPDGQEEGYVTTLCPISSVPTLSEWGVIGMGALLASLGLWAVSRGWNSGRGAGGARC